MLELFSHNQLAIELLRQAWFRRPDEFWVLFELGQLSPNPDDAIRFCTGALAIRPHTEVLQNELSVQFYRKKDYNEAIAHAREAIRLRTGFAYAHLNLGRALTATGLHEGAMVAYRAAIEIAPNFWEAHYDLADELHDQGLFDAAIAEYRETICFNSNFLEAQLKLWDELHRKGQSKDAFDEYRKMIPFNSNFLEMHLKSWDELRRYGQLNVALDEYREALRLKPDEAQPRIVNLGKRLLEQKEFADAEAVLRECVASSEATDPDRWTTFNRKSLLAGSLLGQAQLLKTTNRTAANEKLTEAEPLLLVAYPGLKDRETKDPSFDKSMLTETIDRLVMLYTHLDKSDEVAKWQTEFDTRH